MVWSSCFFSAVVVRGTGMGVEEGLGGGDGDGVAHDAVVGNEGLGGHNSPHVTNCMMLLVSV